MKLTKPLLLLPALAVMALSTSCTCNRNANKTIAGATIGAVTGAVLDKDGGVGGAIAGGVIGGVIGTAAGNRQQRNRTSPYYYPNTAPNRQEVGRHTYPNY